MFNKRNFFYHLPLTTLFVVAFSCFIIMNPVNSAPIIQATSINDFSDKELSILTFTMPYCGYCKKQGLEFKKYRSRESVPMIWAVVKDSPFFEDLKASGFETNIYPTTFIVVRRGNKLVEAQKFRGYQPPAKIIEELNFLKEFMSE